MDLDRIVSDAADAGIPVIRGVSESGRVRVFCDYCFEWHWHGGYGMKVPHCPSVAGYYVIIPGGDARCVYASRWGKRWRWDCWKCARAHTSLSIGPQQTPHEVHVVPRPGKGSPLFCTETGRFFDIKTRQQVWPGHSEMEMARYHYLLPVWS